MPRSSNFKRLFSKLSRCRLFKPSNARSEIFCEMKNCFRWEENIIKNEIKAFSGDCEVAYHLMQILFAARKSTLGLAFTRVRSFAHVCLKFYYLLVNEFVKSHKNANFSRNFCRNLFGKFSVVCIFVKLRQRSETRRPGCFSSLYGNYSSEHDIIRQLYKIFIARKYQSSVCKIYSSNNLKFNRWHTLSFRILHRSFITENKSSWTAALQIISEDSSLKLSSRRFRRGFRAWKEGQVKAYQLSHS